MKVRKVKVVRPFYFNRQVQAAGQVIELPDLFALECLASKKVEPVEEAQQAEPKAMKESAEAKDDGKGDKRKK